jgi:hypothetical protein
MRRAPAAIAATVSACLALLACGDGGGGGEGPCRTSTDCPAGMLCVDGACLGGGDGGEDGRLDAPGDTDASPDTDSSSDADGSSDGPDGETGEGGTDGPTDVPADAPTDEAGDGPLPDADDGAAEDAGPEDVEPDGFRVDDDGDTFPESGGDCDDADPRVFPGATGHVEGIDYDCDGRIEYLATFLITVDDWYERLCVNDVDVVVDPVTSRDWYGAESYSAVLESGLNAVGVHGVDLYEVISAFMMRIEVNGVAYPTTGIAPGDPDTTPWRYSPDPDEDPQADWCQASYDDSLWGPARYVGEWGSSPWGASPPEFSGVGADWIWDDRPVELQDAWFRLEIVLP